MSWAGDNPEQWDKVTVDAVTRYFIYITPMPVGVSPLDGIELSHIPQQTIRWLVENLQAELPGAFQKLVEQIPQRYLWDAEADYFASLIDGVMHDRRLTA